MNLQSFSAYQSMLMFSVRLMSAFCEKHPKEILHHTKSECLMWLDILVFLGFIWHECMQSHVWCTEQFRFVRILECSLRKPGAGTTSCLALPPPFSLFGHFLSLSASFESQTKHFHSDSEEVKPHTCTWLLVHDRLHRHAVGKPTLINQKLCCIFSLWCVDITRGISLNSPFRVNSAAST